MSEPGLTMREVVTRTGIEAATLRMWEQRHGFPVPQRLPSGHRRYSERDVTLIAQVVQDRESGLELRAALERAKAGATSASVDDDSIFAGLRRRRPELQPYLLPKRALLRISHAIEDECSAGAESPVLFASFQRERHYRQAEARWRDMAGPARRAVVLADVDEVREPEGAPVEVPIDRSDPIGREWSLICDAPTFTACLSGWERPGQDSVRDLDRKFEMFWSVDPSLVREAAGVASSIVDDSSPRVGQRLREALPDGGQGPGVDAAVLTRLTNRMVAYVSMGDVKPLPAPHSSAGA